MTRSFGVLMALSSLPGEFGIGDMGRRAREFADTLKKSGAEYWQLLPLTQPGPGDSPYQSASAFAGSWYYIDPEELFERGLLTRAELSRERDIFRGGVAVDYALLYKSRIPLLHSVYERGGRPLAEETDLFAAKNSWADAYCRYMEKTEGLPARFYMTVQSLFCGQWTALRKYCNGLGLKLIGDMPIYVAPNGAEEFESPGLFDKTGAAAGCPPDAFSKTGQHWGNPLYDWDEMKKDGYGWWIRRFGHELSRFDIVRLDHFRGFESYWSIPAKAETAAEGAWKKGPGAELFDMLGAWFGALPVIAEDLGSLTPSFYESMAHCGYPGINVLQFAFSAGANSSYLPHNTTKNRVVCTGTHDNDTTRGWYKALPNADKRFLTNYLGGGVDEKNIADKMIRLAFSTVAELAVIPMQDILGLDGSARMNTPGTVGGNWRWRMKPGAFDGDRAAYLLELAETYARKKA